MGAESPEVGSGAPGPGAPGPGTPGPASDGTAADGPPAGQPVALDLRDHVLFDPQAPRAQPITSGGDLSLQLICLEPKQSLPATTLDVDRLYTVIGGRAWTVIDDAEIHLDPLQAVLVPAGAAHGLRNDSADPLILQVVDGAAGQAPTSGAAAGSGTDAALPPQQERDLAADEAPAPEPAPESVIEPAPRPDAQAPEAAPRPVPSTPERDRFARIRKLLGSGD